MTNSSTDVDDEFRKKVRDFLNSSLTDELREAGRKKTSIWQEPNSAAAWQQVLHRKGWLVPEWPVEYGGTNWSLTQRYIFAQECARYDVPGIAPMGLVLDLAGGIVSVMYRKLRVWLQEVRTDQDQPSWAEWFEWLGDQAMKRKVEKAPAHIRHRDWEP